MTRHRLAGGIATLVAIAAPCSAQLQATLETPTTPGPALLEFGYGYDTNRGVTVLFAGDRLGLFRNDVYEWDGANWSNPNVASRPGPRGRPTLGFDEARNEMLVFGGVTNNGTFLSDTLTYDGAAFTQRTVGIRPGPRSGAAMAYDPNRQVVVLFGGFVSSGQDNDETWEWNGNSWTSRPLTPRPPARGAHRMTWDPTRDAIVMFGGFRTPLLDTVDDTWQYDGTAWTTIPSATTPTKRCDQALAFDAVRGKLVMYGGLTAFQQPGNIPVTLGDFWVLDSNGWQSKSVAGLPSSRSYPAGVWDATNEQFVVHGGFSSATTFSDTYTFESASPADMQAYGAGCPGSNGVPALAPGSLPWTGSYYDVNLTNGPGGAVAFMVLGLSDTIWNGQPIPVDLTSVGLAGCQAWLSSDVTALFVVVNGEASWGLNVCTCPWAVGIDYSLQAVILDPAAPNQLGGSMTNALRATIGDW
ncbi:MAG: kelch repeat-containing protein [bacterium]|nr:kelch repeat-containing protein [bacterium]